MAQLNRPGDGKFKPCRAPWGPWGWRFVPPRAITDDVASPLPLMWSTKHAWKPCKKSYFAGCPKKIAQIWFFNNMFGHQIGSLIHLYVVCFCLFHMDQTFPGFHLLRCARLDYAVRAAMSNFRRMVVGTILVKSTGADMG